MIAIALLVLAIVLPWRLILMPVLEEFESNSERLAGQEEMLARYRRLADSRDLLRKRLEQLQAAPASQEGYLAGESETLVEAELQKLVRSIVERSGGRVESTQILPAASEGEFQRITLRVRMAADTDALFRVFYDLESMVPYLFIDSVDVVSQERRGRRSQGTADQGTLGVSYDVYGYRRSG